VTRARAVGVHGLVARVAGVEHHGALLEAHDPPPPTTELKGGLLIAPLGRGTYVYTGLSFFRQLPAGVPGAYRLFVNLLGLKRRNVP